MRSREGVLGRIDDWLNPIVVKELRQAMNGKFVASALLVLLAVQLIALGLILVSGGDFSSSMTAGRDAFMILQAILLAVSLLFVPAYTGARLALERSDANVDLLFITTIRPVAIVWGKLFSALVVTVLIFSACMPFLVFTYWLRGIDLPSIFVMLSICFLEVAVCINLATLIACLPTGRVLKILLSLVSLFIFLSMFWSTVVGTSFWLLRLGIGTKLATWEFWEPATTVLLIVGAVIGLLFSCSTALLTPVSANRAMPVRTFITVTWLGSGLVSTIVSIVDHSDVAIAVWALLSAIIFSGAFFVAVSERDSLGARVLRLIPTSAVRRRFAFFFFSGAANGIAWAAASTILTLAAFHWISRFAAVRFPGSPDEVWVWIIGLPLYAYCYAGSGRLLQQKLLSRWISQKYTWGVALVLLFLGCVVPFLIGFLVFFGNWQKWDDIGGWMIFNPFALDIDKYRGVYLTFAAAWAIVVTAVNASWLADQVSDFRSPEPAEAQAK